MKNRKTRKMSSRVYNKLYAKRGKGYLSYCLWYYESDDNIITEHKASLLGKIVLLVLYPFVFIINFIAYGMSGVSDLNSEFIPTLKGKPFSQDDYYPRHGRYWKEAVDYIESGKLPERINK